MSEASSSAPNATTPAKPEVSPIRNLIGLVVLAIVVVVGVAQVRAVFGYNTAVNKLNARAEDETKDLMSEEEAETLMGGKKPTGEAEKVQNGNLAFLKKTYTWSGPIKSYPLYAYYQTTARGTYLHHFETEGEKYVAEQPPAAPPAPVQTKVSGGGPPRTKKAAGKNTQATKGGQQPPAFPPEYIKAMSKDSAARPDAKKADNKADDNKADDKAPAAKADDKKADDKKADDNKADDKKADDKKADDKAK